MGIDFVGSLAFITGGASGIGEQICIDLATEGGSVIIADRNFKAALDLAANLPRGEGCVHVAIQVDVSKKTEVDAALAQVLTTYGRPAELVVNCAGVVDGAAPLEDIREEDLDTVMDINFKGTFLVTQAFGRALLEAKKTGSIVNVSSVLAWSPWTHMSHYCASKAAMMQFTKVAAKEWGPRGIRVNSVHPGLIDTPLAKAIKNGPTWREYEKINSLRRVGQPIDVSKVVLFFLSEKSGYVTGSHLEVSGQGY